MRLNTMVKKDVETENVKKRVENSNYLLIVCPRTAMKTQ